MGRRPNPNRKFEVLDAVTEHVVARGLHQTALRALAEDLGTSTYTFVYHFGSKDGMIRAVLDRVNDRYEAQLDDMASNLSGDLVGRLRTVWQWALQAEQLATAALMLDALSLARVQPELYLPAVRRHAVATDRFLAGQLSATGKDACCSAATASVLVGLQTNFLTDGDRAAADARFERLVHAMPLPAAA